MGSIFKAVFIPYAVNLALDKDADNTIRQNLILFLRKNADVLSANLNRGAYPEMYCSYYWGEKFSGGVASMGAQASGASLLEGVTRMNLALDNHVRKSTVVLTCWHNCDIRMLSTGKPIILPYFVLY